MQANENADKTVEQIATEKYPYRDFLTAKSDAEQAEIDSHNRNSTLKRLGFIDGYTTAQQSQPMWREIEMDREYEYVVVRTEMGSISQFDYAGGAFLAELGYTHYLSLDDLLKLPTLTKTTPQERG